MSSGLFFVPLNAYLQQRSDTREKGRIIATNNFYNTIGMLLASGRAVALHDRLHLSADRHHAGLRLRDPVLVTAYIVTVVPDFLIRFVLWLLTHTIFRIRIVGQENVPFRGPALLVSNHMSHVDGFLIGACVQRFIRFMVWKPILRDEGAPLVLPQDANAIPVGTGGPRDMVESIRAARQEIGRRPRGLHLRRRRHQPHRQHAALQARHGKNRRRRWTCPSFRCTWTACGAASSASRAASSSGSGPSAFRIP